MSETAQTEGDANNPKLAFREKLGYGLGAMTENNMQNSIGNMTMPIMNILMGIDPVLLGYVSAISRVFDAVTDPLMGFLSDKTKSRWGRRKPYILIGSILGALTFLMLWMFPMTWSPMWILFYFLAVSLLYFASTTIYCVPYISFGYELSTDYNERTQLMGFRMFFVSVGNILVPWIFWFTQRSIFPNALVGMRWAALIVGALFILCALGPLLMTKRHRHCEEVNPKLKKVRLRDIFSVLTLKPFLCIVFSLGAGVIGVVATGSLGTYIGIYYVCAGNLDYATQIQGVGGTISGILGLLCLPLLTQLSYRFGKRYTLIAFLLLGAVGAALSWYIMTPAYPYLSVVTSLFMVPCMTALWMLLFSMMADVCEYDELHNWVRREGIFAAVLSWVGKVGITLSLVAAGYILNWSGFRQELGMLQSPDTLWRMRMLNAVVPATGLTLAALAIWLYPLTAGKLAEIKRQLQARLGNDI